MSLSHYRDLLPNGLRVVTLETPHLNSALVTVFVGTGSRHELPEHNGVTHLLEHLFFRGSEGFPDPLRLHGGIEALGGNLNGTTGRDQGTYFTPLAPAAVPHGLKVLGDLLSRPLLSDLEIEREIVLEELLDELDEHGRDIDLDNLSKQALFGEHPLGMKIAGTARTVAGIDDALLRRHHARSFVTGNVVVTVAGRVRRDDVLARVEEAFAALPSGPVQDPGPPPPSRSSAWTKGVAHEESQTGFRVTFPTVPESHPDHIALQLIKRILDDGLASRLPREVVERRGLAYSVSAEWEGYLDTGLFELEGAAAPKKAGATLAAMLDCVQRLRAEGPTEEELDRVRRRHRALIDFSQDDPFDLTQWFGAYELYGAPESFAEHLAKLDGCSAERVREVAERYLDPRRGGLTMVGPRQSFAQLEASFARFGA